MRNVKLASLLVALCAGFAVTAWFVWHAGASGASGAFESPDNTGYKLVALTAAYGFAITLLGVALGAIYRRLLKLKSGGAEKVAFGQLLGDVFTSIDFQLSLVGAPIVYGLLWQSLTTVSIAGITIIALQNGFASHAVLNQLAGGKPPSRGGRKKVDQTLI